MKLFSKPFGFPGGVPLKKQKETAFICKMTKMKHFSKNVRVKFFEKEGRTLVFFKMRRGLSVKGVKNKEEKALQEKIFLLLVKK